MKNEIWTLLDEAGETALFFTSFLDISVNNGGEALSYPIEEGAFANYNKTRAPLDIKVTLAVQAVDDESSFERLLEQLNAYQEGAVKLSVATPSTLYENMTLKAYHYSRTREAGAGMLVVELNFVEVREVKTQVAVSVIVRPKNPTSAGKKKLGKVQTKDVPESVLEVSKEKIKEFFFNL